jgi:hypothetical protein
MTNDEAAHTFSYANLQNKKTHPVRYRLLIADGWKFRAYRLLTESLNHHISRSSLNKYILMLEHCGCSSIGLPDELKEIMLVI